MRLPLVEILCAAIVVLYLAVRLRAASDRAAVGARLVAVAAVAWLGEESMIRAYGFYGYAPGWHLFLDRVPLAIAVIWPLVIDSAEMLAARLVPATSSTPRWRWLRVALVGAAIVLVDASLVEPIAVAAGLWRWSAPGFFGVPPVGVLGWALFAAAAIALVERRAPLPLLALAVPLTHVGLLVAWWGALRWLSRPLDGTAAAIAAWLLLLPVALALYRARLRRRVPVGEMLVRVPPALLFLALLATGSGAPSLFLYAAAFVAPYCALVGGKAAASSSALRRGGALAGLSLFALLLPSACRGRREPPPGDGDLGADCRCDEDRRDCRARLFCSCELSHGATGYCTETCSHDDDCPKGWFCEPVLDNRDGYCNRDGLVPRRR